MRGRVCLPPLIVAALALTAAQDPAVMTTSGRIVSAATGKPVPGAAVAATCDGCDAVLRGTTDADGRFRIEIPEPARYRVAATAPGFIAQTYGSEPELGGTPVLVAAGAQVRGIDFALHRGSTIAGTVIDEFKDPVVGATVRALTKRSVDGEARLVTATTTRSDDRGRYRLIGLDPGEYLVSASDTLHVTLAPSAAAVATARRVAIDADAERDGVNIQMKPAPRGAVEGLIAGPGAGAPAMTIGLVPDPNPVALPALIVRPQPGNRFAFADVPAGRYVLAARPAGGTGRQAGAPGGWARDPVVVKAGATTHVALTLRAGARVSGRVVPAGPIGGRIQLSPVGADHPEAAPAQATVDPDGGFTIANVAPGRYRWTPTLPPARSSQWLMSVFVNDADVTDAPLAIAPDTAIDNVRVTLTAPARVAGTVLDARGGPTTAGAIVMAATESRYWTPVSRRIGLVRPDTEGTFEFSLPAGRYRVAHVSTLAPGQLWDPAFLKTLAGAREISAVEGQLATVQLRLK